MNAVIGGRVTMVRNVLVLGVLVFVFGACSDDAEEEEESGSTVALAESCHRDCDAQAAVMACIQNVEPELCNALCDSTARDQPAECAGPYKDYYECRVAVGFECSASYVSQKTDGCDDLARALGACQNGGEQTCAGVDENGGCAAIMCPCPSGPISISGGSYETGSCVCFDTTTCLDSC